MSTESIKVFVDKRLDKTVDFYYYQIIRRVIYNENKESFQKNTTSILNESDLLITRKTIKILIIITIFMMMKIIILDLLIG